MKHLLSVIVFCSIAYIANAQSIFTYGGNSVSKQEFLTNFDKNNTLKEKYTKENLEKYLSLYALYKMKVKEAEALKFDTAKAFQSELTSYKQQLAKSYMTDEAVKEELLNEAYNRSKEEINVAHILIAARGNDTVEAFKKINEIYKKATLSNSDFATIAAKYSEDKGSASNGGNIGYISSMDVVYPFESIAYNTEKGKISKPFRTDFGYHILKVLDRRPSAGKVQVAHILINAIDMNDPKMAADAKSRAEKILSQLRQGANYDSMAKAVSQDKYSINNNGILPEFGSGKMDPEFEKAAFALQNPGDVSELVRTDYGYHILKLIKKIPVHSLASVRDELMRKIEGDARLSIAMEAYQQKELLKKGYKAFPEHLLELRNNAFIKGEGQSITLNTNNQPYKKPLFTIGQKQYLQSDFLSYVQEMTDGKIFGNKDQIVDNLFNLYLNKQIQDLQIKDLEENDREYQKIINEYREGILLFNIMDQKVWSKATNDNEGIQNFYNKNKSRYTYGAGFRGIVYKSQTMEAITSLKNLLIKGEDPLMAVNTINSDGDVKGKVIMEEGTFEYNNLLQNTPPNRTENPISEIYTLPNGQYMIYLANEKFSDGKQKTLEEAKGLVISEYQEYLETEWNNELRKKYPLVIDQAVFDGLIR